MRSHEMRSTLSASPATCRGRVQGRPNRRNPPFRARQVLRSAVVGERALGADEYVFANLVGAHEIAERLGFRRVQIVYGWVHTEAAGFPTPVRRIGAGRGVSIWFWPDVEEWARPRYPDQLEAWHYSLGQEDGPAPGRPGPGPAAELIDDINAGRVRTE